MKGLVAVLCLMAVLVMAVDAYTCPDFVKPVAPCTDYLTEKVQSPSAVCCAGVNQLKDIASNTAIRQQACNCLKTAAAQMANIQDAAAVGLAGKCGTTTSVPISKNVDCSKIT